MGRVDYEEEDVENVGASGDFHTREKGFAVLSTLFPHPNSIILYYFKSTLRGLFCHFLMKQSRAEAASMQVCIALVLVCEWKKKEKARRKFYWSHTP